MSAVDEIALVERGPEPVDTTVAVVQKEKKKKPAKKYKRTPFCYYHVIIFGTIVLLMILGCVAYETYIHTSRLAVSTHSVEDENYHKKLVHDVNEANLTWKAVYNRYASRSSDDSSGSSSDAQEAGRALAEKRRLSAQQLMQDTRDHVTQLLRTSIQLPSTFDSRQSWSNCWAVHQIFNQAGCGSCWSVAATSVMSDRLCIASNGSLQTQISALDLTSCCHSCGGCQGTHWALSAFTYWKEHGIVSGGSYGSHEGCRPYSMEPNCGSPCASSQYNKKRTPQCDRKCAETYSKTYEEDKSQARRAYWLRASQGNAAFTSVRIALDGMVKTQKDYVELIQKELILHGPVLACFTLYEDFQHYSSGIYTSDDNRSEQLYGHCAKLLGWGQEHDQRFWLYSNTWGRDWGENGFFRVAFAEVPEEVVAGHI